MELLFTRVCLHMSMAKVNVEETIFKYETFINDVLKEDLRQTDLFLQRVNFELSDLIQEKHSLKVLCDKENHPYGFKSQVNLGCNFFMEAHVKDTSTMLVNIGLNHFLELTLDEANKYLDTKMKAFESKAAELRNKSAQTKAHIKLMLFGINELNTKSQS